MSIPIPLPTTSHADQPWRSLRCHVLLSSLGRRSFRFAKSLLSLSQRLTYLTGSNSKSHEVCLKHRHLTDTSVSNRFTVAVTRLAPMLIGARLSCATLGIDLLLESATIPFIIGRESQIALPPCREAWLHRQVNPDDSANARLRQRAD